MGKHACECKCDSLHVCACSHTHSFIQFWLGSAMGKRVCIPVWMEGYFGRVQWVGYTCGLGGRGCASQQWASCCLLGVIMCMSCACHGVCSALARGASGQECACAVVGIESGGWDGEIGGSQGW